jgi:hypothetical protein
MEHLDGLGWVRPFPESKHLRDAEHGVSVEFLIAGQYPGDERQKPIAFPNPADVAVEFGGIRFLSLPLSSSSSSPPE